MCVRVCLGKKHVRGISYHHPPSRIPETDVFVGNPSIHMALSSSGTQRWPSFVVGGENDLTKRKKEFWQLSKDPEKNHANQKKSNRWSMVFKGILLILHIGVAFVQPKLEEIP